MRYTHVDVEDLQRQIAVTTDYRRAVIITYGVFSMDGDVAPLDKIAACIEAVNILEGSTELVDRLWKNAHLFRQGMSQMAFGTGSSRGQLARQGKHTTMPS